MRAKPGYIFLGFVLHAGDTLGLGADLLGLAGFHRGVRAGGWLEPSFVFLYPRHLHVSSLLGESLVSEVSVLHDIQ